MALTTNTYTYTGGAQNFLVSFSLGFIKRADVKVWVNGQLDGAGDPVYSAFDWIDDSTITVTDPLTNGDSVTILRTVPKTELEVSFKDGADITPENLDLSAKQGLMVYQELIDGRIEGAENPSDAADRATASAADAQAAEDAAELAQLAAEAAEAAASTSETNAGNSAAAAAASAAAALVSEGNAATSETNAAASETNAAASESAAASSESNAAASESNAATSESNAATSETNAAAKYDDFDDRYLGPHASEPVTDNDGDPLLVGALYFNETDDVMQVWTGTEWIDTASSVNGTANRETYTATAGQTTFSIVHDEGFVDVYMNGVKLLVDVDFTESNGVSIILTEAAEAGDILDIVAYGTFQLGVDVNGTANRQVLFPTAGTTTFNIAYNIGFVDVYLNGSKLTAGYDFTATNGTTVVLTEATQEGDVVDMIVYGSFSLHDGTFTGDTSFEDMAATGTTSLTDLDVTGNMTVSGSLTLSMSTMLLEGDTFAYYEAKDVDGSVGGTSSAGMKFYAGSTEIGHVGKRGSSISRHRSEDSPVYFESDHSSQYVGSYTSAFAWKDKNITLATLEPGGNFVAVGQMTCYNRLEFSRTSGVSYLEVGRSSPSNGTGLLLVTDSNGTNVAQFNGSGTATSATTTVVTRQKGDARYTIASLSKFKDDQTEAYKDSPLFTLNQLQPKKWVWNDNLAEGDEKIGRVGSGLVVEDVMKVMPEAVTWQWNDDGIDGTNEGASQSPRGLDPMAFISLLVSTVQQQQTQIDALAERIEQLEG